MSQLDDPSRGQSISCAIRRKPSLNSLYREFYDRYRHVLKSCPESGLAVEIGSGVGFARECLPELTTTDLLAYDGLDLVMDARHMPFADQSVRFFCLLNVFHHIPDVAAFLSECQRCLKPGGRLLIVDQYPGWLSHWIFRYLHHEPYRPEAVDWSFRSTGPLSGANGALAWIVFIRDRCRFERQFPHLQIARIEPHTPLRYWLSGGLKHWTLLPRRLWRLATRLDCLLLKCSGRWGSFLDVELVRTSP